VIKTMIVDDQEDIRLLLRMMIDVGEDDLEVSCEAASGLEAIDKVDHCDPTVIVLDEMMPGMNGIETAAVIRGRRPEQRMILCTAYLDDELMARGRATGVVAFVHKDQITTMPRVIREVVAAG
jgi:CheY-like chemotaxis protein